MNLNKKLGPLALSAPELFAGGKNIIIFSDIHRGTGTNADNFDKNQNLLFYALSYYFDRGYTYIELGDGDELWENRDIEDIKRTHSHIFWLLGKYHAENRLHMLYGNHDACKKDAEYMKRHFGEMRDEASGVSIPLMPEARALEALKLNMPDGQMLLFHGHQADPFNDRYWRLSRFLVRYLWRGLELVGIKDPTRTSKNDKKKNKVEKRLSDWAARHKKPVVCGHTHKPVFPDCGDSPYYNCGCCVHPRCITGIEIINGEKFLIKWSVKPKEDGSLYIGKDILEKNKTSC